MVDLVPSDQLRVSARLLGNQPFNVVNTTLLLAIPLDILQNGRRTVFAEPRSGHLRSGAIDIRPGTLELRASLIFLSCQFSPSLVSRLSSPAPDAESTKPTTSTDEIVRRRLAAEAEHIRAQEAEILNKISAALEKENLDKEKPGMSSEVLGRDIEEVREKVERMKKERESKEGEGVRRARQGVVECYR